MRGLFVLSCGFGAVVGFIENKVAGVVRILKNIEATVAPFLDGGLMILGGSLNEGIKVFGLDVDMDQSDVHGRGLLGNGMGPWDEILRDHAL